MFTGPRHQEVGGEYRRDGIEGLGRNPHAAIEREGEALGRLGKIHAHDKARRRKAKRARSRTRRECTEAIGGFDAFEAAMATLRGALECVDLHTGSCTASTSRRWSSRRHHSHV